MIKNGFVFEDKFSFGGVLSISNRYKALPLSEDPFYVFGELGLFLTGAWRLFE